MYSTCADCKIGLLIQSPLQPYNGKIVHWSENSKIILRIVFEDGVQNSLNENPDLPYKGNAFKYQIPDAIDGRVALNLLKSIFKQRKLFVISRSNEIIMIPRVEKVLKMDFSNDGVDLINRLIIVLESIS